MILAGDIDKEEIKALREELDKEEEMPQPETDPDTEEPEDDVEVPEDDDMKKRAFMLVGILLISIVMSACSSNSKSLTALNPLIIVLICKVIQNEKRAKLPSLQILYISRYLYEYYDSV